MVRIMGLPSPRRTHAMLPSNLPKNKEPEETAVLMWPSELDTAYLGNQMESTGCQYYGAPMREISYNQLLANPLSVIFGLKVIYNV